MTLVDDAGAQELGDGRLLAVVLASVRHPGCMGHQAAQCLDLSLGIGNVVLDDLFLGDRYAELDVLHGELDRFFQRPLSAAQGQRAHAQAAEV